MRRVWQVQEAKNKLSQVIEEAIESGPQVITRRGAETAVVISYDEYRRLVLAQQSVSEFFRGSPLVDAGLDLTRDRSPIRAEFEPA